MGDAILNGAKVLVLEDDALINLNTTETIQAMGCVVHPLLRLSDALVSIQVDMPDVAVLDVNINGRMSYELAQLLVDRDVPIVFLTGYDSPAVEEKWRQYPVCRKPCDENRLKRPLVEALAGRRSVRA
jgi:DNA-binding LytR/AlgR family response regulator